MTRKTAILGLFTLLSSRAETQKLPASTNGSFIAFDLGNINYIFAAKQLTLRIDGREVVFTAKELADALGAK